MQHLSTELPKRDYDVVKLILADHLMVNRCEAFFNQPGKSLANTASHRPAANADLRNNILRIILRYWQRTSSFCRFQPAVFVPQKKEFELDTFSDATGLLDRSGLSRSISSAQIHSNG
jgi:hypothetical protein